MGKSQRGWDSNIKQMRVRNDDGKLHEVHESMRAKRTARMTMRLDGSEVVVAQLLGPDNGWYYVEIPQLEKAFYAKHVDVQRWEGNAPK